MRAEFRAGTRFAGGAVIPLVVPLVGFPIAGVLGLWVEQSLIMPVGLLGGCLCSRGCRAFAGASGGGWTRARFGASFPVGLVGPLLIVANLGGVSGQESFAALCLAFAPLFAMSNVPWGPGGLGLTGRGGWMELRTLCLCRVGGALGGALLPSTM